jgi:hypothetical protein
MGKDILLISESAIWPLWYCRSAPQGNPNKASFTSISS